jgi:transketolase
MTAAMLPASIYPAANSATHHEMANAIRALAMDAVEAANSGHPGMPMGMADVATVLFSQFLKFDPAHPTWPDRDRFVLSAGHGSMLLYALLYLTGYERMPLSEIKKFRQLHSHAAGHPEVMQNMGIETTTGPLGQGIATAVGMALAERMLNARHPNLVEHYTYVIASDGDMMEGISHEACSMAGHWKLNKLIVLYDDNGISIDGETKLSFTDNTPQRFESYGWNTWTVDGHNAAEISAAIAAAQQSDKPALISCKTTIGYGAPTKANKSSSHGSALGKDEVAGARLALEWPHEPFHIPDRILNAWREAGARGGKYYAEWQKKHDAAPDRKAFDAALNTEISDAAWNALADYKKQILKDKPKPATRAASGQVLEVLAAHIPSLIGGSADLTGSNLTKTKIAPKPVQHDAFDGSYIYYGVREHGMAAAMNGLALHGGFIPYGGTFLVFSDYCRPSIRLAALMEQRVIHVMTHDSIGLGEDGPTHQPVEHLSSLRAIPNVHVYRPADAIETAECWELALRRTNGPSILALSRQNLPTLRTQVKENNSAYGAYVLSEASNPAKPQVVIIATGSEVHIAHAAQKLLEESGIPTRLVSAPCLELFAQQDADYQNDILPPGALRVAVEAAGQMSWDKYLGLGGLFIGMQSFGASAPAEELYKHFGLTAPAIATQIKNKLKDGA